MNLEIRHLHCILAVARHLHFARAADELGIAPPSLTKQIQDAERLLKFRLFERTRRSVSLTAAGEAYIPAAAAALAQLEQARELGLLAERGQLGRIRIGYIVSAAFAGVMRKTVTEFRRLHPLIDIEVAEIPMDEIPGRLVDRQIDVAYVRPPMRYPEELQATRVQQDEFVVALPEDSALASQQVIAPQQLRDAQFAVPEQESGTAEVARRGRFSPRIALRPGPLIAVLASVSLGETVAIIPAALSACVSLPGVVYRPLAGKPIPSELALLYRRHERSRAVRAFLQYVRGEVERGTARS
ncbi:LysR family transcriptional regulator [Paraburkholderia caballeronis]|uniref:LysR family transcriptional regulator n=1 Tax=Paraburkholderia caballeronis TaxID=416943 RepID=UPI001066AB84|nr:LysR family transcriptional regulator [Paraburkholderia caballeronis]TDV26818.1 LysR family transcriptional regulator [Paraburkholderia caballeronis]